MSQSRTVVPGWSWSVAVLVASAAAAPAARAQGPAPAQAEAAQVGDLTTRYRFIERYSASAGPTSAQPGEVGQYRVAARDVIKMVAEKPQGAPDRKETTVQVIYTERPAVVGSTGMVAATVRRYDALRVVPQPELKPSARKPLEGLTVWLQPRPGGAPLILSMTGDHPLTETEFGISTKLIFMPDLVGVLPALPSRVGDHWRVPRSAAQALLGDRPMRQGEPLIGTLVNISRAPDKPEMVAVVGVTGHAVMPPNASDTVLNAQVTFRFPQPAPQPEGAAATVDARGAITELRLARSSTATAPGGEGRLKRSLTWELTLQRDLNQVGEALPIPSPAPAPTEANSWLTYDDPKGRFRFRHPQDMHPQNDPQLQSDGVVQLIDDRVGTTDGRVLTITLQPKTGKAEDDRNSRDPEFHKKDLNENWSRNKRDVLRGPSAWLPEAEWSPYKMKVYRIEAAEKPSGPAGKDVPRIYLDHYLVLFTQNESLSVDAMTGQDPPLPFRKQVEAILKTFTLNPAAAAPTPP